MNKKNVLKQVMSKAQGKEYRSRSYTPKHDYVSSLKSSKNSFVAMNKPKSEKKSVNSNKTVKSLK